MHKHLPVEEWKAVYSTSTERTQNKLIWKPTFHQQ